MLRSGVLVADDLHRHLPFVLQLRQLMPTGYYRFQPALNAANHSLDNTSPANMAALKELANRMIEEKSPELETLCEQLTASRKITNQQPATSN